MKRSMIYRDRLVFYLRKRKEYRKKRNGLKKKKRVPLVCFGVNAQNNWSKFSTLSFGVSSVNESNAALKLLPRTLDDDKCTWFEIVSDRTNENFGGFFIGEAVFNDHFNDELLFNNHRRTSTSYRQPNWLSIRSSNEVEIGLKIIFLNEKLVLKIFQAKKLL